MQYASTEDTIAAISTPRGEGGIGIVRLSGPSSLEIAANLFVSSRGRDIRQCPHRVFHGHVHDASGQRIDEVLLHVMRAPHSYTAEDVVEINAHGGMAPLQAILEETLRLGARPALPGEFTQRAFLNGRLDLTQAEAVMDLIGAKTRTALNAANAAADGMLARALRELRDTLADALARIEAAVDFPEDDLPDLVDTALIRRLEQARDEMKRLAATADAGLRIREGVAIAVVGRPNVGKSSLFNALLRDARALVSPEPGTTRDRIEETAALEGVPVRLMDTAGLRDTPHAVELMGVALARRTAQQADYILFVVDASQPCTEEDNALATELARLGTPVVLVRNKMDLIDTAYPPPHGVFAAVCNLKNSWEYSCWPMPPWRRTRPCFPGHIRRTACAGRPHVLTACLTMWGLLPNCPLWNCGKHCRRWEKLPGKRHRKIYWTVFSPRSVSANKGFNHPVPAGILSAGTHDKVIRLT